MPGDIGEGMSSARIVVSGGVPVRDRGVCGVDLITDLDAMDAFLTVDANNSNENKSES